MVKIERIDLICEERGWSRRKLEREAGIAVGSMSKWVKVNPSAVNLKKVADVLQVSTAYLLGESEHRTEQDAVIAKWIAEQSTGLEDEVRRIEAGIRIPVFDSVPCDGIGVNDMLDADGWEEISEKLSRTGTFFGVKVKTDSMSPRIQEGDVLIVRQQCDFVSGDVVIAKVKDDDPVCRKVTVTENGVILQAFNPVYDPVCFQNSEMESLVVIGKVIENRQKF